MENDKELLDSVFNQWLQSRNDEYRNTNYRGNLYEYATRPLHEPASPIPEGRSVAYTRRWGKSGAFYALAEAQTANYINDALRYHLKNIEAAAIASTPTGSSLTIEHLANVYRKTTGKELFDKACKGADMSKLEQYTDVSFLRETGLFNESFEQLAKERIKGMAVAYRVDSVNKIIFSFLGASYFYVIVRRNDRGVHHRMLAMRNNLPFSSSDASEFLKGKQLAHVKNEYHNISLKTSDYMGLGESFITLNAKGNAQFGKIRSEIITDGYNALLPSREGAIARVEAWIECFKTAALNGAIQEFTLDGVPNGIVLNEPIIIKTEPILF